MSDQNPTVSALGLHFEEEIEALAYRYFEEEGRPEGKAQEHWSRAEREVRGHRSADNVSSETDSQVEVAMQLGQ